MTLVVDGLTHRYGDELAVDDVSFEVGEGELVALVGPSGCGKTTLVQSVAGHVRPTAGRVLLRGADVTEVPPESRDVGVVFQRSTLYPHMSVRENVAYGLAAGSMDRADRAERVDRQLELVDLADRADAHPAELSGGQGRRAELARALAPRPDVLLLDEPLSALDRALRDRLQAEVARVQRETDVTTLFVTHDQDEAMTLADRLVVMADGTVEAVGDPRTLYESPPTPFVASFLGRSTRFRARVLATEPPTVEACGASLSPTVAEPLSVGDAVVCHVRPADLSLRGADADPDGTATALPGTVTRVLDRARRHDITVRTAAGDDVVVEHHGPPPADGESVAVAVRPDDVTVFAADEEWADGGTGEP